MGSCCQTSASPQAKRPPDRLFWGGLIVIAAALAWHAFAGGGHGMAAHFSASVADIVATVWWGIAAGIVAMGFLTRVPREFVMSLMGSKGGLRGLTRAVLAGFLFDLCNHGILMIGAKLYERGLTAGQVMAFLLSSPWNSLSLTLILAAMIGWQWTAAFIVLSMVVGIVTGWIFERLVARGMLPQNPHRTDIPEDFRFWPEAKKRLKTVKWTPRFFAETLKIGLLESRMVLRWMFLGVIIAASLRALVDPGMFETLFGPTLVGLAVTLVAATVIEVCSEGSAPLAADILTRASAPGNGFTFLMAGASTDYTEFMVIREATKSWKIALALPIVSVPQILLIGWLLNQI